MRINPRIWIYGAVGLIAVGILGYEQWNNSDEKRLQRCVDASIAQMKQDTPALNAFDNAQPMLVSMAQSNCARQLGITLQGE